MESAQGLWQVKARQGVGEMVMEARGQARVRYILILNRMSQHPRFSFHYYLDLGNNKISPIFITEQSDPYVEASKLCAKEHLHSIFVTIIGDAIKNQMQEERNLASSLTQQPKNTHSDHFYSENTASLKQQICISDTLNTELRDDLGPIGGHPLSAAINQTHSTKSKEKANVFEHLYNNYKKIEHKKELSRKKSFEAIPFRPQINSLSKKIVQNKRMMEHANSSVPNEKKREMGVSVSNGKISSHTLKSEAENLGQSVFNRSSQYSQKSQEKQRKLREAIDQKLMESCSFRPRINTGRLR